MIRVLRHFERADSGYIVDYIVLDDLTVNTSYCKDYARQQWIGLLVCMNNLGKY